MANAKPACKVIIFNAQQILTAKKCSKQLVRRFTHYLSTRHMSLKGLHKLDYMEIEKVLNELVKAIRGGYGGNPMLIAKIMSEDMSHSNIIWTSRMADSFINIFGTDQVASEVKIPVEALTPHQFSQMYGAA